MRVALECLNSGRHSDELSQDDRPGVSRGSTHLNMPPISIPVPQLDGHVITRRQDERQGRMNRQATNVIWMGFDLTDFLAGVVIVASQLEIITACQEPVLARDESNGSNGYLGYFKCLDERAGGIVVNLNATAVQTGEDPWFRRVKIDRLDSIGASKELSLDVE